MHRKRLQEEEKEALEEARKGKGAKPVVGKQSANELKEAQTMPVPKKTQPLGKSLVKRAESGLAFSLVAADLK